MNIKEQLYLDGIKLALLFCKVNRLPRPAFYTYAQAAEDYLAVGKEWAAEKARILEFWHRVYIGPVQGTGTGLYYRGTIFVNVPVTALPVTNPHAQHWSFPCWKIDRTAMGVVAHELGHHCQYILQQRGKINDEHGEQWRCLIQSRYGRKRVSGYEPVPSEANAETLRLFILNPDLLKRAIPGRYEYVTRIMGLKPSEQRTWKQVLHHHPAYVKQGIHWIAQ